MADTKISKLEKYSPIIDGIRIPCSVETTPGKWQSKMIVTEDFGKYVSPTVLDKVKSGKHITVRNGVIAGTIEIDCDIDTDLFKVVNELPTSAISENKVYLVPKVINGNNIYEEYVYNNGAWEKTGEHSAGVDTSNLVTVQELEDVKSDLSKVDGIAKDAKATASQILETVDENKESISILTTELATLKANDFASSSDFEEVKNIQTSNTAAINNLKQTIGERDDEGNATGLLADIDALEAAYKSADDNIIKRLNAAETKLAGVATDTNLAALSETVDEHTIKLNTIDSTVKGLASKTELLNACGEVEAKLSGYVKNETLDGYATKTDLNNKANQLDVNALTTEVAILKTKPHLSEAEVNTLIVNGTTNFATKKFVTDELAKIDVSSQLTEYLTKDEATTIYASQAAVTDIVKVGGTIDKRIASAKTSLEEGIEAANNLINALTNRIKDLEDKLAQYDKRFGYTTEKDEDGEVAWTKTFLRLD